MTMETTLANDIARRLNSAGKILRDIQARTPLRQRGSERYVPPRTPTEETLARLWAEALTMDRVGSDDNFFTLGGHSLLAMQLSFAIRDAFAVPFALEDFLQYPTVAAQSDRLQDLILAGVDPDQLARLLREIEEEGDEGAGAER